MFTEKEIAYINSQHLARLATVSKSLRPDVAPVGFRFGGENFSITGFDITKTFKYKNVKAGNELTKPQVAEMFTKVIGRPVTLTPSTGRWGNASEEEMKAAYDFFNGEGYDADIAALRKLHPGQLNFEQYLRKNGCESQQPIPIPENAG